MKPFRRAGLPGTFRWAADPGPGSGTSPDHDGRH